MPSLASITMLFALVLLSLTWFGASCASTSTTTVTFRPIVYVTEYRRTTTLGAGLLASSISIIRPSSGSSYMYVGTHGWSTGTMAISDPTGGRPWASGTAIPTAVSTGSQVSSSMGFGPNNATFSTPSLSVFSRPTVAVFEGTGNRLDSNRFAVALALLVLLAI